MKENTVMLTMYGNVWNVWENLLFQGLHGSVLDARSLLLDPLRFIRDQECHNDLNYDEHMLQKHTKVQGKRTYVIILNGFLVDDLHSSYLHSNCHHQNVYTAHLGLLIQLL